MTSIVLGHLSRSLFTSISVQLILCPLILFIHLYSVVLFNPIPYNPVFSCFCFSCHVLKLETAISFVLDCQSNSPSPSLSRLRGMQLVGGRVDGCMTGLID